MTIVFLCLSKIWDINDKEIYPDLLREFINDGNDVYVFTPLERRYGQATQVVRQGRATIIKVKTLNIQKANLIEKGIGTVLIERQYLRAIKQHLRGISVDLVLYATPPITLAAPVRYLKNKYTAKTYLMLKDIFPQNAVDLGMISKSGIKSLLYQVFRKKERQLYAVSDRIGCMSPANAAYVSRHNPEIESEKVELCPNSAEFNDLRISEEEKREVRVSYGLPEDKCIFVYGGNLGKPQGIPFLIQCLQKERTNPNAYFLIIGDGTDYPKLQEYLSSEMPENVRLMKRLSKMEYRKLVAACDVGLIFLDYRFTIPNFPSRLLDYMQAGLPVLACTDPATDIGKIIQDGGFGWSCMSNRVENFDQKVSEILEQSANKSMGDNAIAYLQAHYSSRVVYGIIKLFLES